MASQLPPSNPLEMAPPLLRRPAETLPIWPGKGVDPEGFWLLSDRISWWGIHWVEGRAVPCLAPLGDCYHCRRGWLPRRTGYACAMREKTGGRYILRISEYAYRQCPALAIEGISYRGTPLLVSRASYTRNAPWQIRIPVRAYRPDLPPALRVETVLSHVWGIDLARLGQCPPPDGDAAPLLRPYRERKGGRT